MSHSTLAPVFAGLRFGLHALLVGLAVFAVARAFAIGSARAPWVLAVGAAFVVVYLAGAWATARRARSRAARSRQGQLRQTPDTGEPATSRRGLAIVWIIVLTLLWAVLTWLSPEGAFLVFPLFFLYLHLLPGPAGVATVVVTCAFAILALGLHLGFSIGGVIGPIVGAGVALLIGLAYRALTREAQERERLLAELMRTREQLARTERAQGALAERSRLAREIHDTVAQGLSSIQMLLRAAERDASEASLEYLQLARETAAENLAETRQIVRELTPGRLDGGLAAALERLGREQSELAGIVIHVTADRAELPMETQTALLRLAQGALSNVVRHSGANSASVQLRIEDDVANNIAVLEVNDDGRGFDLVAAESASHVADSFGLRAMRERVGQLGGEFALVSRPGKGTEVIARLPVGVGSAVKPAVVAPVLEPTAAPAVDPGAAP